MLVCGTRTDTGGSGGGRQVSEGEGRGWAERHRMTHVLTSAALGTGVNQAFHVRLLVFLVVFFACLSLNYSSLFNTVVHVSATFML